MQLEAKNISFSYSEKSEQVLKNINIKVKTGERIAILGPSGCGKSTLAKILSGYMTPNEGEVLLDGQPLPQKGF